MVSNGVSYENGVCSFEESQLLNFLSLDDEIISKTPPIIESVCSSKSKWVLEVGKQVGEECYQYALAFLNLCSDEKLRKEFLASSDDPNVSALEPLFHVPPGEKMLFLKIKTFISLKLAIYDKVLEDALLILQSEPSNPFAYKCLLCTLCKLNKFEQAREVLRNWSIFCPKDVEIEMVEMIESRNKVESLIKAISNGIEPSSAFANIENRLGLTYEKIVEKSSYDCLESQQWRYRPLPSGINSFVLCLQHRFGGCSLGDKCTEAHGQNELEEWKTRHSLSSFESMIKHTRLDSGKSYIKSILDSLSNLPEESTFLTKEFPGYSINCSQPLHTKSNKFDPYSWLFTIESENPLSHICLLYEQDRSSFKIGSAWSNQIDLMSGKSSEDSMQVLEVSVSPTAKALYGTHPNSFHYSIEIQFIPLQVFGTFRQTVLFDFLVLPKLRRDIVMEISPSNEEGEEENEEINAKNSNGTLTSSPSQFTFASNLRCKSTWNFGNADIVDSMTGERVTTDRIGFALMTSPKLIQTDPKDYETPLSKETYKERMRYFLTQEEKARQVILSKYNISAHLNLLKSYDMTTGYNEGVRFALEGRLFAKMVLFRDISEDTAVGRLILRSCNSVLLAQSDSILSSEIEGLKPRVYLCPIVEKAKNAIYFDIGTKCVSELGLRPGDVYSFDIQFQLDRTSFMEQKRVIDSINDMHLDMLFPDFTREFSIPWNPFMQWNSITETQSFRLNPRQKEAFIAVTAKTDRTPPILIIGPFGTGKTFTLVQCIKKLLTIDNTRIMICTHSNSAADLYIKEYLDPLVEAGNEKARPLRIYYFNRSKYTINHVVLKYCIFDPVAELFRRPTREEILSHKIIVVTLSTSYMLIQLDLPKDTFSHILLDEAAQAMESEAITPLLAAGENTKLVLAGDHMQLSPELFSEDAKHIHSSLLERLHCFYPDNHPCKLMLCENYRSHSAIIQFASDSFYQKKLECGMAQPVHSTFYPLTFFSARGEDVQDNDSTSYYNMAEVFALTERVSELVASWPESWGNYWDDNAIGVLTPYPDQVAKIRNRLRAKKLGSVSVERVLNVQGKQFRAVFLSTVRTQKAWVRVLPQAASNEVDLGFFSNPKLLNTALTRAQSLVAVVGDPVSLCSLGKCRRLWEDFINICKSHNSLFGMTFDQIKESIVGVELRMTWGLNPLANEFEPKNTNSLAIAKNRNIGSGDSAFVPPVSKALNYSLTSSSHYNNYLHSTYAPQMGTQTGPSYASATYENYMIMGGTPLNYAPPIHNYNNMSRNPLPHPPPPVWQQQQQQQVMKINNICAQQTAYMSMPPPPQQAMVPGGMGMNFPYGSPLSPMVQPPSSNMYMSPVQQQHAFYPPRLPQIYSHNPYIPPPAPPPQPYYTAPLRPMTNSAFAPYRPSQQGPSNPPLYYMNTSLGRTTQKIGPNSQAIGNSKWSDESNKGLELNSTHFPPLPNNGQTSLPQQQGAWANAQYNRNGHLQQAQVNLAHYQNAQSGKGPFLAQAQAESFRAQNPIQNSMSHSAGQMQNSYGMPYVNSNYSSQNMSNLQGGNLLSKSMQSLRNNYGLQNSAPGYNFQNEQSGSAFAPISSHNYVPVEPSEESKTHSFSPEEILCLKSVLDKYNNGMQGDSDLSEEAIQSIQSKLTLAVEFQNGGGPPHLPTNELIPTNRNSGDLTNSKNFSVLRNPPSPTPSLVLRNPPIIPPPPVPRNFEFGKDPSTPFTNIETRGSLIAAVVPPNTKITPNTTTNGEREKMSGSYLYENSVSSSKIPTNSTNGEMQKMSGSYSYENVVSSSKVPTNNTNGEMQKISGSYLYENAVSNSKGHTSGEREKMSRSILYENVASNSKVFTNSTSGEKMSGSSLYENATGPSRGSLYESVVSSKNDGGEGSSSGCGNSNSDFVRSYANAVKKPLSGQSSGGESGGDEDNKKGTKFIPLLKPLMEMNPFPPNYSPPPRLRSKSSIGKMKSKRK